MSEGQPVAWSTYVATDNADGVAERVKSNGGQVVVEPMDVMELGRMTVFVDPAGAGDSFAGGLMGSLAASGKAATRDVAAAMVYGTVTASFAVSTYSLDGLARATRADVEARAEELRRFIAL